MKARLNNLNSSAELETLIERSNIKPALIFKHSTTCPISSHVLHDVAALDAEINLVVVQQSRMVSDEIAARFGVRHESPQAIVISGGQPIFHASHYDVSGDEIAEILGSEEVA